MDAAYMFLNFYVFYFFLSGFFTLTWEVLSYFGLSQDSLVIVDLSNLPIWAGLVIFFILNDFVQWFTHFLLHRYNFLWQFHKVHHSVEEMGFAAHLRYHWMENVFYKPLKALVVLILFGVEPSIAFIVHFISITIGHLNHANIKLDYGPLKYILNNPKMHIWHHAMSLPEDRQKGVNFGISLSIWDYIFKLNYIPSSGKDIELGFTNLAKFPKTFVKQLVYGFGKNMNE